MIDCSTHYLSASSEFVTIICGKAMVSGGTIHIGPCTSSLGNDLLFNGIYFDALHIPQVNN